MFFPASKSSSGSLGREKHTLFVWWGLHKWELKVEKIFSLIFLLLSVHFSVVATVWRVGFQYSCIVFQLEISLKSHVKKRKSILGKDWSRGKEGGNKDWKVRSRNCIAVFPLKQKVKLFFFWGGEVWGFLQKKLLHEVHPLNHIQRKVHLIS